MEPNRIAALLAAALLIYPGAAPAQNLSWDTNLVQVGAQGGTGNWVGTDFWFDGATNVQWRDNSQANFGGTAGAVTVNSGVAVNGMQFSVDNYSIDGGSAVTLVGPVIDVVQAGHVARINAPLAGNLGLVKNGAGSLALLGGSTNTFTGTTLVNDGTLFFNKSGNAINGDLIIGDNLGAASSASVVYGVSHQIPDSAGVTVNSDGFLNLNTGERQDTIGTLEMNGGLVSTALGAGALAVSAVQSNANATTAMITGQLDLGGAPRTFNVANGAAASDLEISANIFSTGGVIKMGAGTMTLTGTSLFTGGLAINQGTVSVPDVADLLVASPIGGGNLSFDGGTLSYTGAANDSTNRSIVLNANGGTFHIPTFPPTLTLSGVVSGPGSLTKAGIGALRLSGTNTFTGVVNINQGSVDVPSLTNSGVAGPLGAGTTININGGALTVPGFATSSTDRSFVIGLFGGTIGAGNGTIVLSGPISGPGPLSTTGNSSAMLVLTGTNTFGGNLFISPGTVRIANGAAVPDSAEVTLQAGSIFDVNNSTETVGSLRSLSAGSQIALGSGTLTIGGDNTSKTFDGVISGTGNLVKIGTGTQTLTGASTFSGTFAINGGAVSVPDLTNSGIAGPLGAGSSMSFNGGNLVVTSITSEFTNRAITLNAGGGTFDSTSFVTLSGVIGGPGGLTKRTGPLTLTGLNTFTGPVTVLQGGLTVPTVTDSGVPGPLGAGNRINLNNGALVLSGAGTHSTNRNIVLGPMTGQLHASNGTLAVSGSLTGSGGVVVTGNGGTVVLSGNNTFTGTLFLSNQGMLRIANGNAIPNSSQVTVLAGTLFDVNGSTETIGALSDLGFPAGNISLGNGTLTIGEFDFSIPATSFGGVISGAGNLVKSGFAQQTLTGPNTFTGGLTILNGPLAVPDVTDSGLPGPLGAGSSITFGAANGVGTLLFTGASDDATNRPIVLNVQGGGVNVANAATVLTLGGPVTGEGVFTKSGPGTLVLSGTNSYSAQTIVTQGVLRLVGGNAIGDTSRVFFNGGTLDLNNTNEVIGSLTGGVASGGVVLGTGTLTTGADPVLPNFSGTISGAGGLTKIGPGTLTLTGTNSYSGPTNVNAGRLEFSGGNALGNSSPLIVAANAIAGFLGGSETIASLAGAGDVELNTGSLIVGADGASTSFSGMISGSGDLTKIGTGTLTLSAAPTYTGATNVNAGTLALNSGVDTAGGTITVAPGAFLEARNVVSRPLAGAGTIAATGTLIIGDASSGSGFAFGGTLSVGTHQVVLADADLAELGPTTTLGAGGRLNSLNGAALSAGDRVTVDAAVSASITGDLTNGGTINGPTGAGQMLSLTGDVDGTGNYTGNVRFTDSFSPGNSAAAVSLENFIFESTHALTLEIGGPAAGSEHDRLNFSGAGLIDGALIIALINNFQPVEGHVFTLLNGGALSGAFDSIALPALNPGLAWQYSQTASAATLAVIPEPSSAGFLCAAVVCAWRRRRKRDGPRPARD